MPSKATKALEKNKGRNDKLANKSKERKKVTNKKALNKNRKKSIENKLEETKDNKFSFDEEIVIGLRRIDEPQEQKRNKERQKREKQRIKG